jgi:hypothetical protein
LWTGPPLSGPGVPQGAPASAGGPYGGQIPPQGYLPYTPYGGPAIKRNNGLAVASLVCACAGFLFIVPGVLGVIFGFIARSQIRQSRGTQGGDGLALAGIIVGFAWIGLFLILVIVGATNNNSSGVVLGLSA